MNLDPATGLLVAAGRLKPTVPRISQYVSPYDSNGPVGGSTVNPTVPYAGGDPVSATIGAPPTGVTNPVPVAPIATSTDLFAQIQNDPLYKQAQADIAAARVSDLGSRTAARQRALTLFGQVPDFSRAAGALGLIGGDIGGDINDTVRQLAQQNTRAGLSTTARIDAANTDQVKAIKDALTARGLLSSGETGYQLNRQDLAYRQANNDALQQLLDLLGGYNNSYLTAEQARQQMLGQQAAAAAGRIPAPTYAPAASGGGTGASDGSGSPATDIASFGLIPAMQTPEAAAWRERGQRGEYLPLN